MIEKISAITTALCLTIYWAAVFVKLIKLARKIGKDPNAMPRERVGQLMRVIWYPAIIVMLVHGWWYSIAPNHGPWLKSIAPPADKVNLTILVIATILIVLGTVITFVCWRKMGRSWRIGIDPGEKLELVSSGPYRYVRHPIYAIRIGMLICAMIAIPTWVMIITCLTDILLLQIEARREEAYMTATHGDVYRGYMKKVGRFVPKAAHRVS